jgi:asparagine synthetase B (glutamine-hydrolysing)
MALYFAARGVGKVRSCPEAQSEPYTSPARMLLNGLGADELLGGYGRHRTAFKAGGWPAVIDEVGHRTCHVVVNILVVSSRAAPTRY